MPGGMHCVDEEAKVSSMPGGIHCVDEEAKVPSIPGGIHCVDEEAKVPSIPGGIHCVDEEAKVPSRSKMPSLGASPCELSSRGILLYLENSIVKFRSRRSAVIYRERSQEEWQKIGSNPHMEVIQPLSISPFLCLLL